MSSLDEVIQVAKQHCHTIVLPEATDSRILKAAREVTNQKIATIMLVGNETEIKNAAQQNQVDLKDIQIVDPKTDAHQEKLAHKLFQLRQHKGLTLEQARQQSTTPLIYATLLVRCNLAHGCVAGAVHATSDVVRTAIQVIGMNDHSRLVSSFFIMEHNLPHQAIQGTAVFADCALVINPSAEELARITIDTTDSASQLLKLNTKVALLSFSTAGSAHHPHVEKVKKAGAIVSQHRPDILLMTEVQFDAAILPEILNKKSPDLTISAPANIFIFPELQSANIGYKIAQRIGGVEAIGPILQGLKYPINDLSRGCNIYDIIKLVAITVVQNN